MKHSIKPYSKDISEVKRAFYKSSMVQKRNMKTKEKTLQDCTYRMNEMNPKTYRYLLKKEGMPSGASSSLDA